MFNKLGSSIPLSPNFHHHCSNIIYLKVRFAFVLYNLRNVTILTFLLKYFSFIPTDLTALTLIYLFQERPNSVIIMTYVQLT